MVYVLVFFLSSASAVTLTEALGAALNRHESIGQARERTVQARKRLDQAQSGPQPSLVLDASYLIQPPLDNPLFREFSPERQRQAKLTLTQPLFRGLREFAALRQSHDFVEAARAGEYQALADLYEAVATAFLQVLALEQDLKNLDEQRAIYSARVKDLLGRSRRGESARNEPLTAQSTQALTIAEIELARARLRTARETFSYMTGLPRESVLSDPTGEPAPKIQGLDFYLGRLETRPDIVIARKNVEAATEQVKIKKGAHWPTLDAIGNYYLERPEGFLSGIDWDVKFQLTFPLYEGGLRVSETAEAASRKRELELELARLRRAAEADIRSLHETLVIRGRHLQALERSTDLSRNNSEVLQRDYRRGLTRNIDVQDAIANYGIAKRGFDQARFDSRLELVRLERAANLLPEPLRPQEAAR